MIRLVLLLAMLLYGLALPVQAAQQLVLGVLAYRPKPVMESAWRPLAESLAAALPDMALTLRILDSTELTQALRNDELDVVFTNPTHFIALRSENALSGALATVVTMHQGRPKSTLGGVIIVRSERTDLTTLANLRGKRVAAPNRNFLGGYVAQAYELLDAGIGPDQIELESGSNLHDAVVDAVLKGEVDAGFIRTGVLEQLTQEGRIDRSRLRVLNEQHHPDFPYAVSTRLYPEWPVVALPRVEEKLARRIAAQLLSLEPNDPVLRAAGIHGFTIPADYTQVESAMRALRVVPFDNLPDFTWRDVLLRYPAWTSALTAAGLIIIVLALGLARGNRQLSMAHRRARALAATIELERERLGNIIAATQVGTWEWNVSSGALTLNARWANMLGYELAELEPVSIETWRRFAHPDDIVSSNTLVARHLKDELTDYRIEVRMRHKAGHWIWVFDCGRLISRTPSGEPLLMVGTHQDISERKLAEEMLRLSASVFTNSYDAIMITDSANRIVDVNPAFSRITGYSRKEVLGGNPSLLNSGQHNHAFYAQMWGNLNERGHWRGEVWNRRKNGEIFIESLSITCVRDEQGQLIHHVAVFSDISSLKAHADELDRIAHFDPLTGVPNRRLLDDRLKHAIAQAERSGQSAVGRHSRYACSIWTASSRSTIASVTRRETICWCRSYRACNRCCARSTPSPASGVTSSCCCWEISKVTWYSSASSMRCANLSACAAKTSAYPRAWA